MNKPNAIHQAQFASIELQLQAIANEHMAKLDKANKGSQWARTQRALKICSDCDVKMIDVITKPFHDGLGIAENWDLYDALMNKKCWIMHDVQTKAQITWS